MRIKIKYQINEKFIMEKKDKFSEEQKDRYKYFKDLDKSYVESENR